MPYAYVKFVDGPKCGHKYTVDASKIKYKKENDFFPCKFPDLKFGETKKYYIEHSDGKNYKGQIIFLESTKAEVNAKVQSQRVKVVPLKNLDTVSEESDNNTITKSKSSIVNISNAKDLEENKIKKYKSLLQTKLNAITAVNSKSTPKDQSQDSDFEAEHRRNAEKDNTETDAFLETPESTSNNKSDNMDVRTPLEPQKDTTSSKTQQFSKTKQADGASQSLKENKASTASQSLKDNKASTALPPSKAKKPSTASHSSNRKSHTTPGKKIESTIQGGTDESTKKVEKLLKEVNVLEGKCKKMEEEKKKLNKRISVLEVRIKENHKDLKELKQLNIDLQQKVIERMDERQVIQSQPGNCIDMDPKSNFVPIGRYRQSDDTYHIGRNRWLPAGVYDQMMSNKQSPGTCVGSILLVIFGEQTLMKSTKTGRISNRRKNKQEKNATANSDNEDEGQVGNKENVEKLDDSKLAICFDVFCHWLKNYYAKINEKYDHFTEMTNFNTYVSKKISYLKRPTQKRKRKEGDLEDDFADKEVKKRCPPKSDDEQAENKVTKKKQKNEEKNRVDQVDPDQIELISTEIVDSPDLEDLTDATDIQSISGSEHSDEVSLADGEKKSDDDLDLTPPIVQINPLNPLMADEDSEEDIEKDLDE